MGSGLIINGKAVPVPGIDVVNFRDDARLRLAPGDMRKRTMLETYHVHLVVVHSTGGIPGGTDLRPQVIHPGLGQSTGGGQRVVASWTNDPSRPGGAHLVVDQDGRAFCCADLATEAAYHAERANGCSVGVEIVQSHSDAGMYEGQLDAAAALAMQVCRLLPTPIQMQVPAAYAGKPADRFVESLKGSSPLGNVVGIVGHRDLTSNRGLGDPGDAAMGALVAAGCEVFDFEAGADLETWKTRQGKLGVWFADGIPGQQTVNALKAAGYVDGIWALGKAQPVS